MPDDKKTVREEYIGWIPTLSGRLFFDNWECSSLLKKTFCGKLSVNQQGKSNIRRVLLSTTVNWKDLKTWHDGNFKVTLISSSVVGENNVSGKVYIYPKAFVSKFSFPKKKNNEMVSINKKAQEIFKLAEDKKDIKDLFEEVSTSLASIKSLKEFYVINFSINKCGFTTLSYDFEHSHENTKLLTSQIICRQAFYFIKYSLHYHQHHSAKDDSLTEIHINEKGSGLNMIKDLKKGLVNMKRGFDVTGHYCLFDAGGIVAYTKSLIESCRIENRITPEEYKNEIAYLSNISDSLNKKAENEERIANKESSISNSFRSLIAVFLAIFAPLTILYKDEIRNAFPDSTNSMFIELTATTLSKFYSNGYYYTSFWVFVFFTYMWIVRGTRKRGGMSVDRFLLIRLKSLINKPTKAQYFTFVSSAVFTAIIGYGFFRVFT